MTGYFDAKQIYTDRNILLLTASDFIPTGALSVSTLIMTWKLYHLKHELRMTLIGDFCWWGPKIMDEDYSRVVKSIPMEILRQ